MAISSPAPHPPALPAHASKSPAAIIDELAGPAHLTLIMAHPDDETLGCGMAMAAAAAAGKRIDLILVTDGEGSHPSSKEYPANRLIALRQRELAAAWKALTGIAPVPVTRLRLRDGASSVDMISEEMRASLVARLSQLCVGTIWTNWHGDGHCDHQTAAVLARGLADTLGVPLWSCPIWGRFETALPPAECLRQFFDRHCNEKKRIALGKYRSQFTDLIVDDPAGFLMPASRLAHFADTAEVFIRER